MGGGGFGVGGVEVLGEGVEGVGEMGEGKGWEWQEVGGGRGEGGRMEKKGKETGYCWSGGWLHHLGV